MRLATLAASALVATPAAGQMIGDDLAATLASMGCVIEEARLAEAFRAEGWHMSDFQAQATALARRGHLVGEDGGRLRLLNWGDCS